MAGVVCVLTAADLEDIDPYWGHAIKDRPVVAVDRVRFAASPSPPSRPRTRDSARSSWSASTSSTRSSRRRHGGRGAVGRRATAPRGPASSGALPWLGRAGPLDGNVCYRYRIDRGEPKRSSPRRARRRGRVHAPGRLPVRDGDTRSSPRWRATRSRSGPPASTRSSSAPRSPPSSRCRSPTSASLSPTSAAASARSRIRRWSRHGRARAQGRATGAHPEPRRRVDGHHRRHGMRCAHGDERRGRLLAARSTAGSTRGLRRQRPRVAATRDAAPGPTAGRPTASTRPASTRTPRRPAPTAPSGRPTCSGSASCRWTSSRAAPGSTRSTSGRQSLCTPGDELRGGGAARRRPRRARSEKVAEAIGWNGERKRRGCRPCSPPAHTGLERRRPHGGRRHAVVSSAPPKSARAPHRLSHRSRPRSCAAARARDRARRRRALRRTTARPAPAARRPPSGMAVKRAAEQVRAQLVEIAGDEDVQSDSYPSSSSATSAWPEAS